MSRATRIRGKYIATFSAGLERALTDELSCKEWEGGVKLLEVPTHGSIVFETAATPQEVATLRAADNVYSFVGHLKDLSMEKEAGLEALSLLASEMDWAPALTLYYQWRGFDPSIPRLQLGVAAAPRDATSLAATNNKQEHPHPHEHHPAELAAGESVSHQPGDAKDPSFLNGRAELAPQSAELTFRVTCERSCVKMPRHGFSSPQAAASIGEGLHRCFGWPGSMRFFDLEVMAWIRDMDLLLGLALIYSPMEDVAGSCHSTVAAAQAALCLPGSSAVRESVPPEGSSPGEDVNARRASKSGFGFASAEGSLPEDVVIGRCQVADAVTGKKRMIADAFDENGSRLLQARSKSAERQLYAWRGYRQSLVRTSLKPSTAYGLLQLADIQPGHVILDPMCGCGTIPLEAADWLGCKVAAFGGDVEESSVWAAANNARSAMHLSSSATLTGKGGENWSDFANWDAASLPLRDTCIDRVLCDMPFGVRCGNVKLREQLCPKVAREVARVLRLRTGRAVLMAQSKALRRDLEGLLKPFLQVLNIIPIDMEGLRVEAFVVQRSDLVLPPPKLKVAKRHKGR